MQLSSRSYLQSRVHECTPERTINACVFLLGDSRHACMQAFMNATSPTADLSSNTLSGPATCHLSAWETWGLCSVKGAA